MGPSLLALKRGAFNALHPQFFTPLWVAYFVINVMVQKWYPWMGGTRQGILRTTDRVLVSTEEYFILPLLVVALSAPFFHLGVRIFCGSISLSSADRILLLKTKEVVAKSQRIPFVVIAFFASAVVWLPNYFIPNEGFGTFWTYPLAMANAFLPFMIYCVNKPVGLLSFGFTLVAAIIMRSKAAFIYPILPIAIYHISRLSAARLSSWLYIAVVMSICFCLLMVGWGSYAFGIGRSILHRDYAFESFAALVHANANHPFGNLGEAFSGNEGGPYTSWMLAELRSGVPSIVYANKRYTMSPSKMVSYYYLPEDHRVLPDAYFNRFLLFGGYYDIGMIGAFINALGFGALYGLFWRKTRQSVRRIGYLWPLFLYLPIPSIATYFVTSGGISYGFINSIIPSLVILCILVVSREMMRIVPR